MRVLGSGGPVRPQIQEINGWPSSFRPAAVGHGVASISLMAGGMTHPVLGVVLAGGASRRMGTPKAMVDLDGRPMAARVVDAIRAAGADAVYLAGGEPGWASELGVGLIPDRWTAAGPLAGLASALSAVADLVSGTDTAAIASTPAGSSPVAGFAADSVVALVVACDQPDLDDRVLGALVDELVNAPAGVGAAAVRTTDGRRHPFPAAWRLAAAPRLAGLVESGARRADAAFEVVDVVEVFMDPTPLFDLDTPADLDRWRADHHQTRP